MTVSPNQIIIIIIIILLKICWLIHFQNGVCCKADLFEYKLDEIIVQCSKIQHFKISAMFLNYLTHDVRLDYDSLILSLTLVQFNLFCCCSRSIMLFS